MDELISLGLDLGSSTTKLVLCRLRVEDVAGPGGLPRVAVTGREVLHASALHATPLLPGDLIDVDAVRTLLARELAAAGIAREAIATGAAIITGETASKRNARAVVAGLALEAGRFVVAAAGPDLEGVLAARGAGAADRARTTGATIAHVDVGGGTANVAVFAGERLAGTATLRLGGKMLEWDPRTGLVTRVSPALAAYAAALGLDVAVGRPPDLVGLPPRLAATLARFLLGGPTAADRTLLLGAPPAWSVPIDEVSCSGGVMASLSLDDGAFTDLGRALAAAILADPDLRARGLAVAPDAGRATVLGAGARSTRVSGATIEVDAGTLPLRDLPVVEVDVGRLADLGAACRGHEAPDGVVLYLTGWPARPRFADLQAVARALLAAPGWAAIAMAPDLAQALGQCLRAEGTGRPIVCLDGLVAAGGDYLDLGVPLPTSGALPVVVKTLAFPEAGV